MRSLLENKVAIVTGAGSGIGEASALRFAEEGAAVVAVDIRGTKAQETATAINDQGGHAIAMEVDVAEAADVERMVADTVSQLGGLDVLFSNAGTLRPGSVVELSVEDWDLVMGVNVRSIFLGGKYAVPAMIERGGGSIVNTASISGLHGDGGAVVYAASKAAVINLTRAMATDHSADGIRVNAVCPGTIETPPVKRMVADPAIMQVNLDAHSMGRLGQPEEIAAAALWLASEESSFVTGEHLVVDGRPSFAVAARTVGRPPPSSHAMSESARSGPLAGLRVLDATADLGRFGTKLLSEAGAEVVRGVGAGERGASMVDPAVDALGGVLDWWFDGGKRRVDLDLSTEAGQANYRELARRADVVIESEVPGRLTELGLDHSDLVEVNPRLTQVSLTPYGRTGPKAHWQSSDLVAAADGGVLAITGLPNQPLNSWGGQNHNFGGFAAAIVALAGVRSARRTGHGQLVDLSLHEVVTGSIENLFFQYFFDDVLPLPKEAERQGSLHWLGAYEVAPAKTGNVMITPTPQAQQMVEWMMEIGIDAAAPFVGMAVEDLLAQMPDLMAAMKELLLTDDAGPVFREAQGRHLAFGEVQTVAQAAENPQYEFRDLYGEAAVPSTGGAAARGVKSPARLVRYTSTPVTPPEAPLVEETEASEILADWPERSETAPVGEVGEKPLTGLKVLDLSWVLAGPFATRILGDLGADVVKVQHEGRATLVNVPDYPYYFVWNRSKRSATIDLKHPDALAAIRHLVEQADVLVENYSSGVLTRLGLGWETVKEWNPRLVYVSMSGPGHEGPWKDVISYAPTIHALCGLTHLTNPEGRGDVGCGFSLNDHAAGFASAFSILAALEHVERTGEGQYVDMAQLEIGTYILGPAMIDYFNNGREAQPRGNVDGLADRVPNGVYPSADGFVAVTANDDAMWHRLAALVGLDPDLEVEARRSQRGAIDLALRSWMAQRSGHAAVTELQDAKVAAAQVQNARALFEHDVQHQARSFWAEGDHDVYGTRPHDRFPALWSESGDLSPYTLAPAFLGEANFEVWSELGGLDPAVVAEGIGSGLFT